MGLTSIAGVFSRYFIVGFFLPAFFTLLAVAQVISSDLLPGVYNDASASEQVLILGGIALLAGLLLLGLNYPILRLYEGYVLKEHAGQFPLNRLYAVLSRRQHKRFEHMNRLARDTGRSETERRDAAWRLDRRFPHDDPALILPTAFGNAIRAFERHSFQRWHLNGVAIAPHIENLLTTQEAEVLAGAKGDVAFFINSSLLTLISCPIVFVDRGFNASAWTMTLALLPLAISALTYLWSVGAAIRWGEAMRASIDLHRRELYTKLGLRSPTNFSQEQLMAWCLNDALLLGKKLPDEFAAPPEPPAK